MSDKCSGVKSTIFSSEKVVVEYKCKVKSNGNTQVKYKYDKIVLKCGA